MQRSKAKGVISPWPIDHRFTLEYEEIIQQKYGTATANTFIALLDELPNVHFITTHFKCRLIEDDADDNKYSDCAVAGQAEWLVTEDSHFNILKKISFPQINVIAIDEFATLLAKLEN